MIKPATFADQLEPPAHEALVLAWRRARVARLTAADSWLSLVGKVWLHEGDNSVGSDPASDIVLPAGKSAARIGAFVLRDSVVSFVPAANTGDSYALQHATNASVSPQASVLREAVVMTTDLHGAPDRIVLGSLLLEVMQRSDGYAVRVRDTESAERLRFPGIDYYPIRPQWRIVARLERYAPMKRIEMLYETGNVEAYESPGAAVFTLDGVEYRVDPVIDGNQERLYLVFSDLTQRDETYPAGRFLYAPLPQDDRVLLDFNQAFNPPCAFTPFAFCPLPPLQNRLQLRIESGEKHPHA